MDPKATAKSKRSHSLHGRRNHPPPSAAAARKKQPPKQQPPAGGEGSTQKARREALPSNWDRYGNDNEEEDGAETPAGTKLADLEVKPKSKGADFSYLIEQARSHPQEVRGPGPESSSFGEYPLGGAHGSLVRDFFRILGKPRKEEAPYRTTFRGVAMLGPKRQVSCRGVSSMLSVRGENLLSLCGDDNFIVDDDPTSNYEVPFLSLDLHALAAQLSKLKLSQRLFFEPDLVPEEMKLKIVKASSCLCRRADEVQRSVSGEQSETTERSDLRDNLVPPSFRGHAEPGNNLGSPDDTGTSSVLTNHEIVKEVIYFPLGTQMPENAKLVSNNYSKPLDQSDHKESKLCTKISTVPKSKLDSPVFEAASTEAELDMLLDSFGQSSLRSFPTESLLNDRLPHPCASTVSSAPINHLCTSQDPSASSSAAVTSLNDTIDDLLAETSLSLKDERHKEFLQKEELPSTMLLPHFPRAPGSMHDFSSSKYAPKTASVDDLLDGLLEEASLNLGEQKQTALPHEREAVCINPASHPAVLTSKPVDDFDSWLDTL